MTMLGALLLANLPVRWWAPFEERFPVARMAMPSAVAITVVGLALVQAVYRGFGGSGTGLLAFYLLASGLMRVAGVIADDVRGDPVLTVIDDAILTRRSRKLADRSAQARRQREGPEVPDRLVKGAAVARPDAELVLLASRVKESWDAGSYLVSANGVAHRIGEPFDVDTPAGVRRAYPLTRLTSLEAIRHAVPYELPALSGKQTD
ncbi:MAG: hypothetical protein WD690_04385 [Vicinamibacterales bacterium]